MTIRRDTLDPVFVARQLEYVRAQALDPALAPLLSRQLIPTNNEVPEGADSYTYRQYDIYGVAKWRSPKATDMPLVNTSGKETTVKPYSFWTGYEIDMQEMLAAQFAGVNLDGRLGLAARRAVEEFFDRVAISGDSEKGLLGLINQTGITTYTVPNDGTGVTKTWSTKEGYQIVRDMHGAAAAIVSGTNQIESPDTLLLPLEQYAMISTTPYSEVTESTILDVFLAHSQYIKTVSGLAALDGASAGPLDLMIAYRRSPEVLEHIIPAEFRMLPAESVNCGTLFRTACLGRTAGVVVRRPKAIAYGAGI